MLGTVDPWFVVCIALGLALVAVGVRAVREGRARRDAQAALRRSTTADAERNERVLAERADLDVLREALTSGVIRLTAGLRISDASDRAHTLLGRDPGSLAGRSVIEAFLDPGIETLARTALAQGSASGEVKLADVDGPTVVVRAVRTPSGEIWLVLDDVSELRRLQRIRAEFIDNLSHELRTPLTTVSLLAETLQRDADGVGDALPARMRDRIAKIEVETGHLVQMVSELLDLSRIESGESLDMADGLDMGRLVATSAERLRMFAERQGVTLVLEAAHGLPPVRGDGARLGQVVVNLVHNAVKFSPDGGEVTINVRLQSPDVVTTVTDHGIGIPRHDIDRVFERFYKVDRARQRLDVGGGTGLGLAIARHVIDQHGGRIWVDSTEGEGSTFAFALPAAPSASGSDHLGSSAHLEIG
jgi:two-component system phosphate regulon sensor histidine kinase PhoR